MLLVDCVLGGAVSYYPDFVRINLGFHVLVMRWTYIWLKDSGLHQNHWFIQIPDLLGHCVCFKFLTLSRYLEIPWRWFFCWFQSYTSCYVWKGDDRSFPWDVMVPRKWDHPDTPEMTRGETSEKFGFQSHKPQIIYGDGVMVERITSDYIFLRLKRIFNKSHNYIQG